MQKKMASNSFRKSQKDINSSGGSDEKKDIRKLLHVSCLFFLLCFVLYAHVYRNIEISKLKYQVEKLKKVREKLFLQVESLRIRNAKKSSVGRIDTLFRKRYGNVPANLGKQIITIDLPTLHKESESAP